MRPLPELTPATEWFWTSGADGVLRVQGCDDCGQLVHPPTPICPSCRSRSSKPVAVSGRGTIVGYTVNSHQWHPAFEPPYVIANVALAEDASVHLTTNIVGGAPSDVSVGQEVTVRFEQYEDVWLPFFEATGTTDPVDRVPEPVRPLPRRPPTDERFEHRAVLSGVGRSALGRRLMVDPLSLAVDACLAAVADAGLTLDDIDGLSTYPGAGRHGHERRRRDRRRRGVAPAPDVDQRGRRPAGARGVDHHRRHGGRGGPVPARAVLPHGLGVDVRHAGGARQGRYGARRRSDVSGPMQEWRAPFGALSASNWIAMNAHQYLHRYSAPREMLGLIALNGRANAARNPAAIYRDPMTMDDYLSARPITSPFGLYDCDVPCDASIAVVVSAAAWRTTCRTRPCASRPWARRSSSGSRGTRARSPTSRR